MLRALTVRTTLQKLATPTLIPTVPSTTTQLSSTQLPTRIATLIATLSTRSKLPPTPKTDFFPKTSASPAQFFSRLKKEERRFSRKRLRFDYEDNFTSALSSPYSTEELSEKHKSLSALLAMSEKYIVEHANRRVDLFFYTLVAYYRTNIIPIEGHTSLQHGRGRTLDDDTNLTQACHSSFTPALLDQTIYKKTGRRSLLSGTHLLESLNSTVELPPFVNAFDDILESICRPQCIKILQKVAVGELNPIQGLHHFLTMMNSLLSDFERQAAAKTYSGLSHSFFSSSSPYVSPKLIALVSKGTLNSTFIEGTSTVNEDYVQLLLRMDPEEKAVCRKNAKEKEKLYAKKFAELQEEILSSVRIGPSVTP
ncbi:hypothetical protein [Legionella sp. km772]|uniref:hypothetical protein n=1 Tax=Legionella sp. km772 TaxID=2498111 RepID=UPI000F8EE76C|nr:hypothetical protein [Legionella sp. km772]RUR09877.1 hypothetical protein ELY15_08680 [Legionella sp. km772]